MEGNQDGTSSAPVQSEHLLHGQNVPIEFTRMKVQIKFEIGVCVCGGLALVGCQVPIKLLYCSPFPAGQGRENMMENNPWIEIKQFAKVKAKNLHVRKEAKIGLFFTSHQQAMCGCFLGSRASRLLVVAPEGKLCK